MSLKQWADNGWLRAHKTSTKEVSGLLAIVERDLVDAEGEISADWRFGIAYNAALKLCTILLHASGYRPERALQHDGDTDGRSDTYSTYTRSGVLPGWVIFGKRGL
jgi:hypothetical protein